MQKNRCPFFFFDGGAESPPPPPPPVSAVPPSEPSCSPSESWIWSSECELSAWWCGCAMEVPGEVDTAVEGRDEPVGAVSLMFLLWSSILLMFPLMPFSCFSRSPPSGSVLLALEILLFAVMLMALAVPGTDLYWSPGGRSDPGASGREVVVTVISEVRQPESMRPGDDETRAMLLLTGKKEAMVPIGDVVEVPGRPLRGRVVFRPEPKFSLFKFRSLGSACFLVSG